MTPEEISELASHGLIRFLAKGGTLTLRNIDKLTNVLRLGTNGPRKAMT